MQLGEPTDDEIGEVRSEHEGKARFLVDECAGSGVARLLRERGYNAKFVSDLRLCGRSDADVFAAARREDRIIVTHDCDFLDNSRFPPHRNPGVILIRTDSHGRQGTHNDLLLQSLCRAILMARKNAGWFRGKKLEFSSRVGFRVYAKKGKQRFYLWSTDVMPLIWED
jgi:predicted nuclease of predicted toxin-antitoxin system